MEGLDGISRIEQRHISVDEAKHNSLETFLAGSSLPVMPVVQVGLCRARAHAALPLQRLGGQASHAARRLFLGAQASIAQGPRVLPSLP